MNVQTKKPIPIIDLFAGPGGLGEGFSSVTDSDGNPAFRIGLSIEKEPSAHKTLTLRAVFRQLRGTPALEHYFSYVRGEIDEPTFRAIPEVADAFVEASREARRIELGKDDPAEIDQLIREALDGEPNWLLIGGPPCQAYSLAGRSRRTNDETFAADVKHFLYREYLRIIRVHRPAVFVMENVKGLLTSKHSGEYMFGKILSDLKHVEDDLEYEIRSFVKHADETGLQGADYVIKAEEYGIPQARHRVILLGVRKDLNFPTHQLLVKATAPTTVGQAIGDLPPLRSRLSIKGESTTLWRQAISAVPDRLRGWDDPDRTDLERRLKGTAELAAVCGDFYGQPFLRAETTGIGFPEPLKNWFLKDGPDGYLQHEARSHMATDLARYMFAAAYARSKGISPKLNQFPPGLMPEHKNAKNLASGKSAPFMDRFRVQRADRPSTTVVSHIAKDGHYYIHYDPVQCRSLTVREAARLQTFPDNYFFEGNRTQQYTQVGNAVPPLLARKLALIVEGLFRLL